MNPVVIKSALGKALRWLIPLIISAIALWLVLRNIAFSQFIFYLSKIGWQTFALATLVYLISFNFRAFCWYLLLQRKVSYKDAFFTIGAGYLLNNIFPFRLGEIGRAVLLDDPDGISGLEVLSSVLVERVFDVFLAAVFVLSMLPRILMGGYDQSLIVLALVFAVLGLVVLIFASNFQEKINGWFTHWGEKVAFIKNWVAPKVSQVLKGLSILKKPVTFMLALSSLAISWILAFGQSHILFRAIYPQPPFWWLVFVLSAAAFGAALPSAPAGWGVFEGVKVAAFALLGVEPEIAFTLAIVVHLMSFVYASVIGLIGLRLRGEAVVALYHRVTHHSSSKQSLE